MRAFCLLLPLLPVALGQTCSPVLAPGTDSTRCHNLTTWGTGSFPLYSYAADPGRISALFQATASDVEDSVLCGYEMFPPLSYSFFSNAAIQQTWPYRYIPPWSPSPEGVAGTTMGYPAGCGCSSTEVAALTTCFDANCDSTADFTSQAQCFVFGACLGTLLSQSDPCILRMSTILNYPDPSIQAFGTVPALISWSSLNGVPQADAGQCAIFGGNTGLFIFSKYPMTHTNLHYVTPARSVISAKVALPGHTAPTVVFCTHLSLNQTDDTKPRLNPANVTGQEFNLYQLGLVQEYVEEQIAANPEARMAQLGNPQYSIPRGPPGNIVANFAETIPEAEAWGAGHHLVDAYQAQPWTQDVPSWSTENPLKKNGFGMPTEPYNLTPAHNWVGSRCPSDHHESSLAFTQKWADGAGYYGYASENFGIRTRVCEEEAPSPDDNGGSDGALYAIFVLMIIPLLCCCFLCLWLLKRRGASAPPPPPPVLYEMPPYSAPSFTPGLDLSFAPSGLPPAFFPPTGLGMQAPVPSPVNFTGLAPMPMGF